MVRCRAFLKPNPYQITTVRYDPFFNHFHWILDNIHLGSARHASLSMSVCEVSHVFRYLMWSITRADPVLSPRFKVFWPSFPEVSTHSYLNAFMNPIDEMVYNYSYRAFFRGMVLENVTNAHCHATSTCHTLSN